MPKRAFIARLTRWAAYVFVAVLFGWLVSFYYIHGKGFTYLIEFGGMNRDQLIPEIRAVNHYEIPNSGGYDGQWYAQIAVHPNLGDLAATNASDFTLRYRARRILFEWTAWLIGGGSPIRVLNAYALQNIVCWYLLAALMLRWFPPVSWGNWFRWTTVLLSFGLIFSVRCALLDGPALLLVAFAMALAEGGHPWLGALFMGIAGVGKDTSIIGATALEPPGVAGTRGWGRWGAGIALVVGPVALWALCLRLWVGPGNVVGLNNFSGPFSGLARKALDIAANLEAGSFSFASVAWADLLVFAGLLAQFLYFALRIRPRDPWWRLGISYAVLLAFLGDAVWQGYPSATARVLLPMTLAFNIAVPRRDWWPLLLAIGNIGVLSSAQFAILSVPDTPPKASYLVEGPMGLRFNADDNYDVTATFLNGGWWQPEVEQMPRKKTVDYWRWCKGSGSILIHNPQPFALVSDLSFGLATLNPRMVIIKTGTSVVWQGKIMPEHFNPTLLSGIELPAGDTVFAFSTDRPPMTAGPSDERLSAFSVRNLKITLTARR